jgi:hypothetical protein
LLIVSFAGEKMFSLCNAIYLYLPLLLLVSYQKKVLVQSKSMELSSYVSSNNFTVEGCYI